MQNFPELPGGSLDFLGLHRTLLTLDHQSEQDELLQLLQSCTPTELESCGFAIQHLVQKSMKIGLYGKLLITFQKTLFQKVEGRSRLGIGDPVGIYYQSSVFDSSKIILEGIIYSMKKGKIILAASKKTESIQGQVMVVMNGNLVTFQREIKTIERLERIVAGVVRGLKCEQLVKVAFKERDPIDINPFIRREDLGGIAEQGNQEQKEAANKALNCEAITLIHGPPGTGKTKTLIEIIVQSVRAKKLKVLACAPSNIAVDNLVEQLANKSEIKICRVGHPARIAQTLLKYSVDAMILHTSFAKLMRENKRYFTEIQRKLWGLEPHAIEQKKQLRNQLYCLQREQKQLEEGAVKEILEECNVGQKKNYNYNYIQFFVRILVLVIKYLKNILKISFLIQLLLMNVLKHLKFHAEFHCLKGKELFQLEIINNVTYLSIIIQKCLQQQSQRKQRKKDQEQHYLIDQQIKFLKVHIYYVFNTE